MTNINESIRTESCADVLDVKNHHIHARKLLGLWFAVFAVKGIHFQSSQCVHAVVNVGAVGSLSPKAMFRCKHMPDVDVKCEQRVNEMCRPVSIQHAGMVSDHSDFSFE